MQCLPWIFFLFVHRVTKGKGWGADSERAGLVWRGAAGDRWGLMWLRAGRWHWGVCKAACKGGDEPEGRGSLNSTWKRRNGWWWIWDQLSWDCEKNLAQVARLKSSFSLCVDLTVWWSRSCCTVRCLRIFCALSLPELLESQTVMLLGCRAVV